MSQTIHNFVVPSGGSFTLDPRYFDFEISAVGQSYYTAAILALQQSIAGYTPSSEISVAADITSILTALDTWSKLKSPTSQGSTFAAPTLTTSTSTVTGVAIPSTMDRYMAEDLDNLIRAFRSAGWDPIAGTGNATAALSTLFTGSGPQIYGIQGIVTQALSAATQARIIGDASTQSNSLQQLLMVDYVSRGNELLFNEMSKLKTAIDLNQSSLSYLNSLQDLMNQKDPQKFLLALQDLSTTDLTKLTTDAYNKFEKDTFSQELGNTPRFTEAQLGDYLATLNGNNPSNPPTLAQEAFQNLANEAAATWLDRIKSNLNFIITGIQNTAGAASVVQPLNTLVADFTKAGSVAAWVTDYSAGSEGDYQRHINDAMVASQAFNDTQREELRNVMFVFEEFYKSATAMLSRMTQLLEKIAGAISR